MAGLNLGGFFNYGAGTGMDNATGQLAGQGINGPAQPNLTSYDQQLAQQQQLLTQLQGMAAGTGPSAAQGQLSQAIQQAMAAQNASAAGGRYGQNAATRQQNVGNQAANMQAGAANQAGQLRAQEQQIGAQGAANVAGTMAGQNLQAAGMQQAGQQAYNNQLGTLYGAEQGQNAQAGMALQGSMMNAAGGATSMMAMAGGGVTDHHSEGMKHMALAMSHFHAAHGSGGTGGETYVGEKGPELLTPEDPQQKPSLITHPMLLKLGQHGRDTVLPLEKGSAPYTPGKLPDKVGKRPTTPAPKHPAVKEEAARALKGEVAPHSPGPGAKGLSPQTAPIVQHALDVHGIHPAVLAHYRVQRALQHATGR